jgi:hypothetical protein
VIRVWILLVTLAACSKKEEKTSNRPVPITEAERKRGDDACTAYVDRLCACAKAKASKDLDDRCHMKQAKKEALKLALEVDDDPTATAQDVFQAQEAARQVISKCVEENLALDTEGCP